MASESGSSATNERMNTAPGGLGGADGHCIMSTVELTAEQLAFLREDLKYTKDHFRGQIKSWEGMPHDWVVAQRNEKLAMVESIEEALRHAR
jgi:hypothetical protein